jgi:hypothetical protein
LKTILIFQKDSAVKQRIKTDWGGSKNEEPSEIVFGTWGKSLSHTYSQTRIPVPGSLVCSDQISTVVNCRKEPLLAV